MNIVDIALDFLEFILLLAGICGICFTLIIPLTKEVNNLVYDVQFDKTVQSLKGEKPEVLEDGFLSAVEVAMMCCSQNSYLVSPVTAPNLEDIVEEIYWRDKLQDITSKERQCVLMVGDQEYVLTGKAQYSPATHSEVYDLIARWCNANGKSITNTRFKVMFSPETEEDCMDNVYRLYYKNNEGDAVPCK